MSGAACESNGIVKEIVARHAPGRGSLIPILQEIQGAYGYLDKNAVDELEALSGISANEIFGVATFYTQFRFRPPAEHQITVCQGTACHVRGGRQILDALEHHLGTAAGGTSKDGKFDLERVACLGCCALAPVVSVDGTIHARVTPKKVATIMSQYAD